jgi:hypothetical protein
MKTMKEKDYIEELIAKNLEGLNDNEPPAGHFERFESRLEDFRKRKKVISLNFIWKAAAAAMFAFLIVNQAIIWFSTDNNTQINETGNQITLASVSPEYEEVEFYYTNAINVGLNEWERLMSEGLISEEEQQMMDAELSEFEQIFEKLQGDLATSPNDERVINAMLEYYQTKLSIIHMIIEKLEEVKQKTNTSHETEI